MSVEDLIYAELQSLVGGRVVRTVAREVTALPYISFQQVGGLPYDYLEGVPAALDNGRFQINTWAGDADTAAQVARSVRQRLVSSPTLRASTVSGLVTIFEAETGLFGTRQDFSLFFVP